MFIWKSALAWQIQLAEPGKCHVRIWKLDVALQIQMAKLGKMLDAHVEDSLGLANAIGRLR